MTKYIHIPTQNETLPAQLDGQYPPSHATLLYHGWRVKGEVPPIADGYSRLDLQWADAGDGVNAVAVAMDRMTADIEAEKAAARLASFTASGLIPLASLYRTALRSYGGDNAETNRAITAEIVAGWFLAKVAAGTMTDADRDAQSLLQFGFAKLAAWNGTNETWTLPWEVVT